MAAPNLTLVPAEKETEIQSEASIWTLRAAEIEVTDAESEAEAASALRDIKALRTKIGETFDGSIKQAHGLHKGLVAKKKQHEAPLVEADGAIRRKMSAYRARLERERREEQARLEAEARKAREAAEAEARELEQAGEAELAETIREDAELHAPPPPAVVKDEKPEGTSYRDNWKAEVTSLEELVLAVASGEAPIALLKVDQVALNGLARAQKATLKLPGVRVWNDKQVAVRS